MNSQLDKPESTRLDMTTPRDNLRWALGALELVANGLRARRGLDEVTDVEMKNLRVARDSVSDALRIIRAREASLAKQENADFGACPSCMDPGTCMVHCRCAFARFSASSSLARGREEKEKEMNRESRCDEVTFEVFRSEDGRVFANVNRGGVQLAHLKAGQSYKLDLASSENERVQIPEGWQLVPKVPTRIMVNATGAFPALRDSVVAIYEAMLAAAPQPSMAEIIEAGGKITGISVRGERGGEVK